jgi:hypothetical protein
MSMSGRSNAPGRLLLALAVGLAGCGGRGKPVKVEGVLTLDGKPFPGATVTFVQAEGNGRSANGLSEEDGSFLLTTFKPDDGALPGEYKITVSFLEADKSTERGNPMERDNKSKMVLFSRMSPEGRAKEEMRQQKARKLVPEVYTDMNRTPLRCTVPVEGKVELKLRSTAR